MNEVVPLAHEVRGASDGPAVVLLHGLGAMGVWWPPELLERLAADHLVVVVDLRDSGRSPTLDHLGSAAALLAAWSDGRAPAPPYTLADMASDVVALLDRLRLPQAHVVGQSMGGMVAQHLAFGHPARVLSLTSISSTTGDPSLPTADPEVIATLFEETPTDSEEAYVAAAVASARRRSRSPLFDESEAERRYRGYWATGLNADGGARHGAAVLADGDRTDRLRRVTVPTLVIHGSADALLPVEGGRATAAAVPGADYLELADVGHELPGVVQHRVAEAIIDHVARADADVRVRPERASRDGADARS